MDNNIDKNTEGYLVVYTSVNHPRKFVCYGSYDEMVDDMASRFAKDKFSEAVIAKILGKDQIEGLSSDLVSRLGTCSISVKTKSRVYKNVVKEKPSRKTRKQKASVK